MSFEDVLWYARQKSIAIWLDALVDSESADPVNGDHLWIPLCSWSLTRSCQRRTDRKPVMEMAALAPGLRKAQPAGRTDGRTDGQKFQSNQSPPVFAIGTEFLTRFQVRRRRKMTHSKRHFPWFTPTLVMGNLRRERWFSLTAIWPVVILLVSNPIYRAGDVEGCNFDYDPESKWRSCECQRLTVNAIEVLCQYKSWMTVPSLPTGVFSQYQINSLSIVHGSLVFLSYDAFDGHDIRLLDLSYNQIDSINFNAFRGLEDCLYQLLLNHNSLSRIPVKQIAELRQLQHLHLRYNRLDTVEPHAFQADRLINLRFLYLDYNQLQMIPSGAFSHLPLQLLTLNNNRIEHIEPGSLPVSLWYVFLFILGALAFCEVVFVSSQAEPFHDSLFVGTCSSFRRANEMRLLTDTIQDGPSCSRLAFAADAE
ncbi:unnamed protein product [Soboliphyme baturini]|uniref:LRRNT domain-containing protein n=1 Tax=Soboliphyme baturini TaxID=241478 RepID=A0A183IHS7_9BILA|nr:unnamed protein product [Soboliphyme baturini]